MKLVKEEVPDVKLMADKKARLKARKVFPSSTFPMAVVATVVDSGVIPAQFSAEAPAVLVAKPRRAKHTNGAMSSTLHSLLSI